MNENIGVILPSRGLLMTETLEELLYELSGRDYTIYWSHGNKLPACFNKPISRALRQPHSHILIVEEDMVLPDGILQELLDANEDVISCDYPVVNAPSGTALYDQDGNAIFTGTGFMLIKKSVLDKMPRPIFRADIEWAFKRYGDKVKFSASQTDPDKVYGHHDITFGLWQYINNKPIKVAKTTLAQRKLVKKGATGNNDGTDEIILFDQYRKINFYMLQGEKVATSNIVSVIIEGKVVLVSKQLAEKLVTTGKAELLYTTSGNILIDFNNNKIAIKALRGY